MTKKNGVPDVHPLKIIRNPLIIVRKPEVQADELRSKQDVKGKNSAFCGNLRSSGRTYIPNKRNCMEENKGCNSCTVRTSVGYIDNYWCIMRIMHRR